MKLRSVALIAVVGLAALALIGAGAHGAFTTSTSSSEKITVGTFGGPPTVQITYPVNNATYGINWGGTITGTAAATGAAISKVQVSIQQTGATCWTGTGNNYTATCPNYVEVSSGTTSWSLTVPNTDLTSADSYKVTTQATDADGNIGTSSTVTFFYYTALPTITITYPVNGTNICACSWKGSIKGTASSNPGIGTTITGVSVSIENTTTKKWWDGISFASSTKAFVEPTGTTSWTLPLGGSSLITGDAYSVIAQASDSLGNVGTSATVSFTYCQKTSPPSVTITYPVNKTTYGTNWAGEITGTASAGTGTSVKSVSVAIEDTTTNKWWNGSSFSASSKTWFTASGTTTWMLALATSNLTSGHSYSVIAQATDSLGNVATSATVDFCYLIKSSPPTVTISYPVDMTTYGTNWTGTFTGTASAGAGASISKTLVSMEDTTTKLWWNGSKFAASKQTFLPVSGTTTWMYTLSSSNLTSGDTYSDIAEATDNLSKTGTSSTVSFTYLLKTAPPSVAITYPVNGVTYGTNWTGTITGSAAAQAVGATISKVQVSIQQTGGNCWTGSGNTYTATCPNYSAVTTGTTSWSLSVPNTDLTSGDSYKVTAQATDSYSNVGTSSTVSFTYDTAPPTVTITYPVNKTTYGTNWTGAITGTASSNAGAGTSVANVSAAFENTTTSMWWNGASFSSGTQGFVSASGTKSWSLGFATSNLISGDSYNVVAKATNSAGNIGSSPTVSFTYNSAPPTVTITLPVNKTAYGNKWTGTITGTAASNAGAGTTIAGAAVASEDTSTKRWWSGTSFSSPSQTFVAASGTTSWSLLLTARHLDSGDNFSVVAEATDSLGNIGTSSTVTFTYNNGSHG